MPSQKPEMKSDFARLYRATVAPLRRHLTRLLGNGADAEEIAHDAYVRLYRVEDPAAIREPEAVLYTTARRLAFNRIKRRQIAPLTHDSHHDRIAQDPAPGVVQQVIARQELQRLESAIALLPPGCRAVLLLRKVELLSHQEIADRLNIAVSTVEKQHARALRLLRAALQNDSASRPVLPPTKEVTS